MLCSNRVYVSYILTMSLSELSTRLLSVAASTLRAAITKRNVSTRSPTTMIPSASTEKKETKVPNPISLSPPLQMVPRILFRSENNPKEGHVYNLTTNYNGTRTPVRDSVGENVYSICSFVLHH